ERRRGDGRHVDVLAVRAAREPLHERQHDLGLVLAVQLELVLLDAEAGGDLRDGLHARALRDLEIRHHGESFSCRGRRAAAIRPLLTAARTASMRTAQTLYSGIFDDGSWAEFVRKFAAESASLTKGMKMAPGRTASVRRAKASTSPRRDETRIGSPVSTPSRRASAGCRATSRRGASSSSPSTRR